MMSNDSTIMWKQKIIEWTNDKIAFITFRIYITIYHTYFLLYCKGYIQMMSNDSNKNVEKKKQYSEQMTKLHSIYLEFTLQYITLTGYYIVKETFRWWVIIAT